MFYILTKDESFNGLFSLMNILQKYLGFNSFKLLEKMDLPKSKYLKIILENKINLEEQMVLTEMDLKKFSNNNYNDLIKYRNQLLNFDLFKNINLTEHYLHHARTDVTN